MLSEIEIQDFKSYKKATLPLAPLSLLIGANASGKSNAIEALRILNWIAQGQKLNAIKYGVSDSEDIVRGRLSDLGRDGNRVFSLLCRVATTEWNSLLIELECRENELHISQEEVSSPKSSFPLYRIKEASKGDRTDIAVEYNNFARGGKKPVITCIDQMAVFTQLETPARFGSSHKKAQTEIPKTVALYQKLLSNILFLDPVPSLMREDANRHEKKLRGDGKNLSGVLYTLCQNKEQKSIVLELIRSLPEQDITDITFLEGRRGDVMVELVESFGGKTKSWDATLLSDGTLRVLAIAAALLSAPEGSLVVIEEVDNGIHPSRAKQLLQSMRDLAEKRELRLLLTTHNPALMDALPDEAMGDVVFCYRNPENGYSELKKLSALVDYPSLIAQGSLGNLVTNGVVERYAKSSRTPEQKKEKALAWLAELEQGEE
ncbi:MAG: ATP-binding protein [Candidatus Electrothrix sp. AW5]|nr:ATP-binding protein [Candidatus Electrothrix gigas]